MASQGIYDKSLWPCFTSDMFWALSDDLQNIGRRGHVEDDTAEYDIDLGDLPTGETALWRVNALRDIRVYMEDWPVALRAKVKSATLCIGSKAVETVEYEGRDIVFKIFSGESFLPLFIMDSDSLTVRIVFSDLGEDDVPRHALHAEGLLVRIKDKSKPFFVAAVKAATITWDGSQLHVNQSAGSTGEYSEDLGARRWTAVHSDASAYDNLWSALPLTDVTDRWDMYASKTP